MLQTSPTPHLHTRSLRLLALIGVVALVGAACSSASDAPSSTSSTGATSIETQPPLPGQVPTNYEEFRAQGPACGADAPKPVEAMQFAAPDDTGTAETVTVVIETSCGPISAELDPALAPEAVNSFVFLAEQGYFDGSVSHRVLPGFMMQAGDPTATGRGGPGYAVADEFPVGDYVYERGTIAMANAGPGTTGSQFFVMFESADWLPPQYTVIGSVVDGFEVLDVIAQIPLGQSPTSADPSPSTPLETIYLESVSVTR